MRNASIMQKKTTNKIEWITSDNIYIFILYVSAFAVISNPELTIITGPIIALFMTLLFFSDKYYSVVALVVFANDSIGTVILGKGSFYWLLIILFLLKYFAKKNTLKLSLEGLTHIAIVLFMLLELMITNNMTIRLILQTLLYVVFLISTWLAINKDSEKVKDFFFYMALTVFVIALSSVFFGGVVFLEGYTDRLGISGVGVGDPNFSSLILNTGIAIMLAQNYRNRLIRVGMILVMLAAMISTVSITGLLCSLILLLVYFLVGMKLRKTIRNILIACLLIAMLLHSYNTFPQVVSNPNIELYIVRIEEKLDALSNKDYRSVTTNRSLNTEINLEYFFSQSAWKQLVGGNPIPPKGIPLSHNTFVDILLRFGLIGTIAFCGIVLKKVWINFKIYFKTKNTGEIFLIKIVFLIFSSALSIYTGNTFALWYMFVMFL